MDSDNIHDSLNEAVKMRVAAARNTLTADIHTFTTVWELRDVLDITTYVHGEAGEKGKKGPVLRRDLLLGHSADFKKLSEDSQKKYPKGSDAAHQASWLINRQEARRKMRATESSFKTAFFNAEVLLLVDARDLNAQGIKITFFYKDDEGKEVPFTGSFADLCGFAETYQAGRKQKSATAKLDTSVALINTKKAVIAAVESLEPSIFRLPETTRVEVYETTAWESMFYDTYIQRFGGDIEAMTSWFEDRQLAKSA